MQDLESELEKGIKKAIEPISVPKSQDAPVSESEGSESEESEGFKSPTGKIELERPQEQYEGGSHVSSVLRYGDS